MISDSEIFCFDEENMNSYEENENHKDGANIQFCALVALCAETAQHYAQIKACAVQPVKPLLQQLQQQHGPPLKTLMVWTGGYSDRRQRQAVAVAVAVALAAAVVTGGYSGGGGLWRRRKEQLQQSRVILCLCLFCHCATGKATTAQRIFAPEGWPNRSLWTAQSFVRCSASKATLLMPAHHEETSLTP
jgi:hypothetical protein